MPGLVEGRARAQHRGRVDAAGDRQVGAGAERARNRSAKHLAGADRKTLPERRRHVVQGRLHLGAGDGDHRVPAEAERQAR